MDHFLKPKDLETSPEDPEAATAFKYWLATFKTFLQTVEAGQATINPDVIANIIAKVGHSILFCSFGSCENNSSEDIDSGFDKDWEAS